MIKDKMKFSPMSKDPVTQAFTQSMCLDAMSLIKRFNIAYDKHRHIKTPDSNKHFSFISAMDVFHKECELHGFINENNPKEND